MLDLIIIGNGNADISRYFVPFYLCTCAVYDLFVYIKLLKTECDYNCKRWITRFAGRWRTQLAALSGVKCRTRRALDFRTHIAASGLSWGFVCLRVGMILKSLYKSVPCRVCRHKVAVLVRLIHTPDRLIISLWTGGWGCVLSFSSLTITAEHYTFCWSLTFCTTFSLWRGTYLRFMVADRNRVSSSWRHTSNFVDLRSSEITRWI